MALNFITKQKNCTRSKEDVSISLTGKKKLSTSIILRNNADRKLTKSGYVVVAIDKDRLYFKESHQNEGYKLSTKAMTTSTFAINSEELNDFALTHSGDFPLLYDKENKLYYIDASI